VQTAHKSCQDCFDRTSFCIWVKGTQIRALKTMFAKVIIIPPPLYVSTLNQNLPGPAGCSRHVVTDLMSVSLSSYLPQRFSRPVDSSFPSSVLLSHFCLPVFATLFSSLSSLLSCSLMCFDRNPWEYSFSVGRPQKPVGRDSNDYYVYGLTC